MLDAKPEGAAASDQSAQRAEGTPEVKERTFTQDELDERIGVAKERGRLQAMAEQARSARNDGGQGTPAGPTSAAAPPPVPPPTREQLQEAVDNNQITQHQMDTETERQRDAAIEQKINDRVQQVTQTTQRSTDLNDRMDRYLAKIPGIREEGSEDFHKASREYQRLLKDHSLPNDLSTEILALENCFGSLDRIPETTHLDRDTQRQTGGGDQSRGGDQEGSGAPKKLTPKLRYHYDKMIEKGRYTGWDDKTLIEELKYVN